MRNARSRQKPAIMTTRFLVSLAPTFNRDKELTAKLKECREKLAKLDSHSAGRHGERWPSPKTGSAEMYIAQGGDYKAKGPEVDAAVPAFLSSKPVRTRLEFAHWLASDPKTRSPRE